MVNSIGGGKKNKGKRAPVGFVKSKGKLEKYVVVGGGKLGKSETRWRQGKPRLTPKIGRRTNFGGVEQGRQGNAKEGGGLTVFAGAERGGAGVGGVEELWKGVVEGEKCRVLGKGANGTRWPVQKKKSGEGQSNKGKLTLVGREKRGTLEKKKEGLLGFGVTDVRVLGIRRKGEKEKSKKKECQRISNRDKETVQSGLL